jgi:TRAP-type C4-dicarboxylate transport system permease small subunit
MSAMPNQDFDVEAFKAIQRRNARRTGLIFASIAIAFFFGIIIKISFFGV